MLADSPYRTSESVLAPVGGVLAGVAASMFMLGVVALLQPYSGLSAKELLIRTGDAVLPRGLVARSDSFVVASGVVYAVVGAALGLLYAVSQDRVPAGGLIAVGVFYGVVIWVVSRVLTSWLFGPILRPAVHSYPWFLACVCFGVVLGGCAAWADRRRPKSVAVVPID